MMQAVDEAATTIVYLVDRNNMITDVSSNWNTFALDNEGSQSLAEHVLGRPLFDFIIGESTRMLMRLLLDQARLLSRAIERDYRCDSPANKRSMRMRISPQPDGALRVEHHLLRLEPQQKIRRWAASSSPAENAPLRRCSFCNQVEFNRVWLEADSLPSPESDGDRATPVRYSVCPRCTDIYQASIF